MYFLGIDSGGTKAAFVLADENGNVFARHVAGGCAVLEARKAGIKEMLAAGIHEICKLAGITPDDIDCLGLGICGYGEDNTAAQETIEACAETLPGDRTVCNLDTYVGWAGSLLFEPGINAIAGTGSIVFGVNANGETARSSGWGAGCDEGSCTWHGHQLVSTWAKQADGRMPRTKLYDMFRDHFGIDGEDERFIMTLNREVVQGHGLPELQRFLAEIYRAGDPAAKAIYEEGAEEIWLGIQAVARKLGFEGTNYPVSYSGGLFKSGACAIEPLKAKIEAGGAHLVTPHFEPDIGALMMAIRYKIPDFDAKAFEIKE